MAEATTSGAASGATLGATTPTLREASFDDCLPASDLLRRLGLGVPEDPVEARRAWDHLWRDNPATRLDRAPPPLGWVLEADGAIVGFFGSIPLAYQLGDRTLLVSDASEWGVEKPFRGSTNDLATAYFGQREVDMFLVTTAIRPTTRIFERFASTPMPLSDYDRVLFWVLDAEAFLRSALRKKQIDLSLGAVALSPVLAAVNAIPGRHPGRHRAGLDCDVVGLSAVGDEFDALWRRKIVGESKLYARRTAEDLRWHFGPHDAAGKFTLIRCRRGGELDGYLALVREDVPAVGLVRAKIADMLVAGDDPAVVDALLAAAHETARANGAHVLELVGFPPAIRERALRSRPFSRGYPNFPFHYKAATPELAAALAPQSVWYPTPFDGDTSL